MLTALISLLNPLLVAGLASPGATLPAKQSGDASPAAPAVRAAASSAEGEHWPQWRGPGANGVSAATDLPTSWDAEKNVVWKTPLPSWSGATPVIWGDQIFLVSPREAPEAERPAEPPADSGSRRGRGRGRGGRDPGGQTLMLMCLFDEDGSVLWEAELDEGNKLYRKGNDASPSPVTDGEHVWAVTGNGQVLAFDVEGERQWSRDLQADYGSFGHNWGYACSPLLHDGKLFVEVLHGSHTDGPSYVVCFDGATGETVWKVDRATDALRESPDAYTTPLLVRHGDHEQIVISGGDYVTGHDLATGEERWRVSGLNPQRAQNYRIVASPLFVDGMVYAPTRVRPLLAIALGEDGRPGDDGVAWRFEDRGGPDVPTPVCDGTNFYMVADNGTASCLDAKTGALIWGPERTVSGTVSASPLLADGKLFITSEEGTTAVLKAGREFELLATNELDGSYTLSSPVAVNGRLYLRTEKFLYCIARQQP